MKGTRLLLAGLLVLPAVVITKAPAPLQAQDGSAPTRRSEVQASGGEARGPHDGTPRDDIYQAEWQRRPTPQWVRYVDQGENDPRLAGYGTPSGIRVEIVAEEPTLINPVGMAFADDGTPYVIEWTPAERAEQRYYEVEFRDGTTGRVNYMWKDTTDHILTLHDTDGDGVYDERRMVLEGLAIPSSLLLWDDGDGPPDATGRSPTIYTASVGHVLRHRDSDGDGTYETHEEIIRGLCGYHHHQVSGMTIGHDGWMYVTAGDDDNRGEGSDGSRAIVLRTGAVFRCLPDGSQLTEFARGFRNPYRDVAFDEFYNMFHVDNDNEDGSRFMGCRLVHIVEGGDYGWRLYEGAVCCRPDDTRGAVSGELPGRLPVMLKTGRGAPAGLLIYNGTRFPEHYRGVLIYPDVFRRLVRAFVVERAPSPLGGGAGEGEGGATFRVVEEFELMRADDPLFRPCQAVVGPDGAIYILDWRTDSGGAGRLWGDGQHGRLYRLSWGGDETQPAIPLESMDTWQRIREATDEELTALLADPDFEKRERAQQELVRRGMRGQGSGVRGQGAEASASERVRQVFLGVLRDERADVHARILALGGLCRFWDAEVENVVRLCLGDASPELRRLAADALARYAAPSRGLTDALAARLMGEEDRSVRRQLALAYARFAGVDDPPLALQLWFEDEADDPYYRDGLVRAIERSAASAPDTLVFGMLTAGRDDPELLEGLVELFERFRTREAAEALGRLVSELSETGEGGTGERAVPLDGGVPLSDEQLARLFASYRNYQFEPPIDARPVAAYLRAAPESGALVKQAALAAIALVGGVPEEELEEIVLALLGDADADVRLAVLRTIIEARLAVAAEPVAELLGEGERSVEERRAMLAALGAIGDSAVVPAVVEMVRGEGATGETPVPLPLELRADALRTLAAIDFDAARPLAEELLESEESALVTEAIRTLGSRPDGARLVGRRFLAGEIARTFLPVVSESLRLHAEEREEAAELLAEVLRSGLLVNIDDPAEVERLEVLVRETGDAERGRAVYLDARSQCTTCHRMEGIGGEVGPDLTGVWESHSVAKLLESILDPSREIKEGYPTWTIATLEGAVYSGLLVVDEPERVVLRDSQGRDVELLADEIDERVESDVSLMPENVVALLSFDELVDLVAFLHDRESQQALRTLGTQWWVVGPYPAELATAFPPEREPDPSRAVAGPNGVELNWRAVNAGPDGLLDLGRVFNGAEHLSAYALTYVYSPADQEATMFVGSDDQVRVWLNGELVHEYAGPRSAAPDQDRVPIRLHAGWNVVLAKVVNESVTHHLYLRIADAEGVRLSRERGE